MKHPERLKTQRNIRSLSRKKHRLLKPQKNRVYTYTEPGYDEEVQPQSEDKPESAETDAKQEADSQPEYNEADRAFRPRA